MAITTRILKCADLTAKLNFSQLLRRHSSLFAAGEQHGITFSRVMESPHGVIAKEAFGPLVSLGYEAALYTPSQFINWNRNECWPASFGSSPVDCVSEGLMRGAPLVSPVSGVPT